MPDLTTHIHAPLPDRLIDRVPTDPAHTYLRIPDIAGESQAADHEEEIDVHAVEWGFEMQAAPVAGRGRRRSAPTVADVVVTLATDASVPSMVLAMLQGKSFDDVELSWVVAGGDHRFERLQLTLQHVVLRSVQLASADSLPAVQVAFSYESFTLRYVEQADDHGAGHEHEVEFDLAALV